MEKVFHKGVRDCSKELCETRMIGKCGARKKRLKIKTQQRKPQLHQCVYLMDKIVKDLIKIMG